MIRRPPRSTLFPYTSSSDLLNAPTPYYTGFRWYDLPPNQDRKSTRLNSSHVAISYAVFCLKKKKQLLTFSYSSLAAKAMTPVLSSDQHHPNLPRFPSDGYND